MPKIPCTLLVDDDETTNFLNKRLLTRMDITDKLLVAVNGLEALSLLDQNCPDKDCPSLILLDINMPLMDGFEFLEAYEKQKSIPKQSMVIIMLTTSLNPGDVEKARGTNVAGFLNKPLTKSALEQIVEQHFA